ncbi:DNA damage-inducible protein 1-like [Aegilops tauschii subsp. strangulata]|uniref:DNA damage-inducible protein 1-like n=1 Tax=Aegilops tauschii subsp. strangulata TaxID=200361 RepID=UPI003CC861B4
MGNLPVNGIPAKVLFDTGTLHCFISKLVLSKHDLPPEFLQDPFHVVSLGMRMSSHIVVPNMDIKMGNYSFLASPIALSDSNIDLILGMDWLSKHKASLDCAAKEIKLTHPSEDVIIFVARDETIWLFSLNEKGEINAISQIPVVREYEHVFPKVLPVLYLGHIISAKGIAVNPEKVYAIVNWEPPQNVK